MSKVKQNKEKNSKGFKTITLSIETEAEAKMLWARLNQSDSVIFDGQKHMQGIDEVNDINSYILWGQLDKVFTLKYKDEDKE